MDLLKNEPNDMCRGGRWGSGAEKNATVAATCGDDYRKWCKVAGDLRIS